MDGLSNASRLSFSSLPSISSKAENHRDLLMDRKEALEQQMARIKKSLESGEEEEAMPQLPGTERRRRARKQPFMHESIDEGAAEMAMLAEPPMQLGIRDGGGLRASASFDVLYAPKLREQTPFGGNGSIRPWRHYLYRNLVPTPLPQSRLPKALRKPTPMRWGYPGVMSHVTESAREFQLSTMPPGPGCLLTSVSSRATLGMSLEVHN